jgi:phospholipase/carboxylesterase
MQGRLVEQEREAILEPLRHPADASVIWLHGLGADGYDFVPLIPELRLPAGSRVRFVFPHADVRPVTINGGYEMRAWYDIRELSPAGRDDEQGFIAAQSRIEQYLGAERATGIDSGRMILAGFSQGGAVALHAGLRHGESLAGIVALSCYLPLRDRLAGELAAANRNTPILMCHGSADEVVDERFGQMSCEAMRAEGLQIDWRSYPMGHSLCPSEIGDISTWLCERLSLS